MWFANYIIARSCEADLLKGLGLQFNILEYSGRAAEYVKANWDGNGRRRETAWDWQEIIRRHRDPDRLDMAIWSGDRLAALALSLTTSEAVELRFIEADPRNDCPLTHKRALIALDASARYAQGLGRAELRVCPINDAIEALCASLGFEAKRPKGKEAYWAKRV